MSRIISDALGIDPFDELKGSLSDEVAVQV
jgi:hypothetical protein